MSNSSSAANTEAQDYGQFKICMERNFLFDRMSKFGWLENYPLILLDRMFSLTLFN